MVSFIAQYWFYILVLVVIVGLIAYIVTYKGNKKALLARLALEAVAFSEAKYGPKTGALKLDEAITFIHEHLPAFAQKLFSETEINQFIEEALKQLKDILKLLAKSKPTQ